MDRPIPRGDFFFYFCFMDLKLTPFSTLFFFLIVEWQEVKKSFRPVKLGVEGVPCKTREKNFENFRKKRQNSDFSIRTS